MLTSRSQTRFGGARLLTALLMENVAMASGRGTMASRPDLELIADLQLLKHYRAIHRELETTKFARTDVFFFFKGSGS